VGAAQGNGGDGIVAMHTGHFLDEIDFPGDIEPATGRLNFGAFPRREDIHSQAGEDREHGLIVQIETEYPARPRGAESDRSASRQARAGLDRGATLAAADIQDQAGGPLHGKSRQFRIHAPLEAVG